MFFSGFVKEYFKFNRYVSIFYKRDINKIPFSLLFHYYHYNRLLHNIQSISEWRFLCRFGCCVVKHWTVCSNLRLVAMQGSTKLLYYCGKGHHIFMGVQKCISFSLNDIVCQLLILLVNLLIGNLYNVYHLTRLILSTSHQ